MKKNVLTTPKDKLLNLAVGAGIPLEPLQAVLPEAARYLRQLRRHMPGRLCTGSLALRQRIF